MIYLDSAATTLQKPSAVARATAQAITRLASPGRGSHRGAAMAAETAFACREAAAKLFHVNTPEQVGFTFNATHGLNIAIKTLVKPGSRVLISGYEHNAVTRPLHAIPRVTILTATAPLFDRDGVVRAFRGGLEKGVDVAVCTHASNVFGYVLPIEEIAALCRAHHVPLIVDASQSAGCIPIDFENLGAAFVAMPGHKGLYGPQGTGLLLCHQAPTPLLEGGTGSASLLQTMPDFLPDCMEAGTHNIHGIAGLLEGLRFLNQRGIPSVQRYEQGLIGRLGEGLTALEGVEVFRSSREEEQLGVLSFRVKGADCEEVGERLGDWGFAVRAGLHCAPLAHQTVGTVDSGTVRASVSMFNTPEEIRKFVQAVGRLPRQPREL